jgi:hypothetical protein
MENIKYKNSRTDNINSENELDEQTIAFFKRIEEILA